MLIIRVCDKFAYIKTDEILETHTSDRLDARKFASNFADRFVKVSLMNVLYIYITFIFILHRTTR